jgi:tRNA(Ile2) C34 agmatinyltransferase TiaS
MTERAKSSGASGWICNRCKVPLEVQKVRLQYIKTIFALNLPVCPRCGMILIDEELATGKMAEAEQTLEDK